MDEEQLQVANLLNHFGYSASCIPEGEEKSADVFASAATDALLVEVKSRIDDIDLASELKSRPVGEPVFDSTPIRPAETEARIARRARRQLIRSRADFAEHDPLLLIWFVAKPELGVPHSPEVIEATLFGSRHVFVRRPDSKMEFGLVYFASHSIFFRYPEICCAMVQRPTGHLGMLLNPHSPEAARLKSSLLHEQFHASGGVAIDPLVSDASKGHFILRGGVDRSDEDECLRQLAIEYPDYQFQQFTDLGQYRGVVATNLDKLCEPDSGGDPLA